jgi:hypothetical protein
MPLPSHAPRRDDPFRQNPARQFRDRHRRTRCPAQAPARACWSGCASRWASTTATPPTAILDELSIETRIHFAVEESLMRMLSFPDVEAHVAEHLTLRDQLERFRKRAQDFEVADDLAAFIQSG